MTMMRRIDPELLRSTMLTPMPERKHPTFSATINRWRGDPEFIVEAPPHHEMQPACKFAKLYLQEPFEFGGFNWRCADRCATYNECIKHGCRKSR